MSADDKSNTDAIYRRWFLDRICTHILAFEGDSQARLFMGSWSDYERDYHERYGKSVETPKRVQYRTLKR